MSKRAAVVCTAGLAVLVGVLIALPALATFPGADGLLVFDSNRTGDFEIFTMNLDGTELTNLTNEPSRDDVGSKWDPGGQKIVFMGGPPAGDIDLFVMNADGTGLLQLTDGPAIDLFPTFCDPNTVIFGSNRDGDFDLWEVRTDGTGLMKVVDLPGTQAPGACRPDGKKITFSSDQDGNFEVYEMDRDGTDPVNLTNHPAADAAPDYSPAGDQVLFNSNRDGNFNAYLLHLDADGAPPTNVTPPPLDAPPFNTFQPRFAPEGDAFLVTVDDGVQADVFLVSLPGGAPAGAGRPGRAPAADSNGDDDGVTNLTGDEDDDDDGDDEDESSGDLDPDARCASDEESSAPAGSPPTGGRFDFDSDRGGGGDGSTLDVIGTHGNDALIVLAQDKKQFRVQVFDVGEPGKRVVDGVPICDVSGVKRVHVLTLLGSDSLSVVTAPGAPTVVGEGGQGDDSLQTAVQEVILGPPVGGRSGRVRSAIGGSGGVQGANHAVEFSGGPGDDVLSGGSLADLLVGGTGADRLVGKGGGDELNGGKGPDTMLGGGGNDTFLAKDGTRDVIKGGPGFDTATTEKKDKVTGVEQRR